MKFCCNVFQTFRAEVKYIRGKPQVGGKVTRRAQGETLIASSVKLGIFQSNFLPNSSRQFSFQSVSGELIFRLCSHCTGQVFAPFQKSLRYSVRNN